MHTSTADRVPETRQAADGTAKKEGRQKFAAQSGEKSML
jgi:hypothetical protein